MKKKSEDNVMDKVDIIDNVDDVFVIQVFVPCGSIHEKPGIYGISHFLEHMKFNKSKTYKVLELKEQIDELGGKFNAYTSRDHTSYFIKTTKEQYDDSIELMFELVFNTQFSENNLETERKVILEEMNLTRAASKGFDIITSNMLTKNNPYRRNIIGRKKDLLKISNTDLKKYNDEHYVWDNTRMLVSCPKDIRSNVKNKIRKKAIKLCKSSSEIEPMKKIDFMMNCNNYEKFDYGLTVEKCYSDDTKIILCFKSWGVRSNDHYLLNFISFVVSNNFSSLLFKELREKKGAVYSVRMVNSCFINLGISTIIFSTTQDKHGEIIEKVLETLNVKLKDGEIGKKEFNKVKKRYLRTLKYSFSSNDFLMEYYGTLIFCDNSSKQHNVESLIKKIEELEFEEFICVCRRLFDFEQMGVYINTNVNNINDEILNTKRIIEKFKKVRN